MQGRIRICGVPVDPVSSERALNVAKGFLDDGRPHYIVTPNPEMAVLASKDKEFAGILSGSDLALADGFGLKLAGWMFGVNIPEIIHGTDFAIGLAWLCEKTNKSMYLLGGAEDAAEKTARKFRATFKNLKIVGAENGGEIRWENGKWKMDPMLVARVAEVKPDVLLIALGHGKQERWLRHHMKRLPSVRIAMGIGGAFDYYSGVKARPPLVVRKLHLEWLWRLVHEPKGRAKRIFNAVVVFPFLALKYRLKLVR